jgi:hypothetical protein
LRSRGVGALGASSSTEDLRLRLRQLLVSERSMLLLMASQIITE